MAACHEFSGEDYYIGKLAYAKAMLVSNFGNSMNICYLLEAKIQK